MSQNPQLNNPLHGIKLADILTELIENLGWEEMEKETGIKCFGNNPTYKSSLKFLRTTAWARTKTEKLYLEWLEYKAFHKL
ncbi:VF530 family DNA-binding protein [Wenyingzhuangia sp. 2_MG-2023]|uniref:VF530 family protein n=1 Tax=Wenyingzhuangia sp. 2_MG-2023 TaxID=3062639 RepID=UPI0026E249CC|nr:VF530 family DNA-binding protein [Wenyingzhuangia sp. 2_MG-2023]MDO6738641.1 VF530 family DNA-binding protein [Wenyingzhuangia sp. 2_MG-2023]MDO6803520.1 VF530 family DNA-binding protein [Wenyingzhuangia sp. 1_MG-2023]